MRALEFLEKAHEQVASRMSEWKRIFGLKGSMRRPRRHGHSPEEARSSFTQDSSDSSTGEELAFFVHMAETSRD